MPDLPVHALRSAVIDQVIANAAFRAELGKDAAAAIEAKFGKQPFAIRVLEEQENELSLLLPAKTDYLAKSFARFVQDLGTRSPTRSEFQAVVIHRFWNDADFAAELRRSPRAAVGRLLRQFGASVPQDMVVRVHEEQPGECLIIVPRPLDLGADLTQAELETVAGGEMIVIAVTGAVAGAIATVVIVDRILPDEPPALD